MLLKPYPRRDLVDTIGEVPQYDKPTGLRHEKSDMDHPNQTAAYFLRILEATRQMAEQRMVQPLLEYVAASVFDITPAERCLIVFFDDDGAPQVQIARTRGGEPIAQPNDQLSRSILRNVRAARAPLLVQDALNNQLLSEAISVRDLRLRSVMCVPLIGHGVTIGAIYVENRAAGGQFDEPDLVPLVLLANQVVVAIENARLVESLEATVAARTEALERELAARTRQAQKLEALGRLAGGVAHDLRNLVMVINNRAFLLADVLPPDHPARGDVDVIGDVGNQVARLTHQLLSFARNEPIAPTTIDLAEVVGNLGGLLNRLLGKRIALQINASPALWPIRADQAQIEQVIVNLAINARDAMPRGGTFAIDLANLTLDRPDPGSGLAPGDYVRLTAADTGVGIEPEVLGRIFEPFFTTKTVERGIGLGLALCASIVTQSGGAISAQSTPGQGTTFTILLPRASDGALEPLIA